MLSRVRDTALSLGRVRQISATLLLGARQMGCKDLPRPGIYFPGPEADRIGRFTFRGTCPTVGTTFGYIYIQAQIYGCGRSLQHIFRTPNSKVTHILAKICRTRPKLNAASLTLSHASTCHSHVGAMTGNHQRDALVVLDVAVRLVQDIPRVEDRPRPALLSLMWHFTVRNTC